MSKNFKVSETGDKAVRALECRKKLPQISETEDNSRISVKISKCRKFLKSETGDKAVLNFRVSEILSRISETEDKSRI